MFDCTLVTSGLPVPGDSNLFHLVSRQVDPLHLVFRRVAGQRRDAELREFRPVSGGKGPEVVLEVKLM